MNKKNVITVIKKEARSYLSNPAAYIVLIVFLLFWEYLFFKSVFLSGTVSLRGLYDVFPWLALFLVPAATMGSFAKESDDGTLELLLTHPIKEVELVVGKFFGSLLFVLTALLFTVPMAFSFAHYGDFDWGVFAGQFLGSLFFAASFLSLGVFASSLFTSQIAALLVTAVGGFLFIMLGNEFVAISLPLDIAPILDRLSLASHLSSMARGVIDVRDIVYFVSFISVFLTLTKLQLLKRKYGNKKIKYAQFQLSVLVFIALVIAFNSVSDRIPGRLDLTKNKVYTLSQSTIGILDNLEDEVSITLYASGKLPAQYSPLLRSVEDTLRDYENAGKGKVKVAIKDPSTDEAVEQEALTAGVQQVQFNVVGQEEFQVKTGYFGLSVTHGEEHEALPFIQGVSDLEYQLTSFIWKLVATDKKVIGFMSGSGEKSLFSDYTYIYDELKKQFDIRNITLDFEGEAGKTEIDSDVDVLVIGGPTGPYDENESNAIKAFLSQGKSVFLMADSYVISPQIDYAGLNESNVMDLFSDLGVRLEPNVIYDLQSHDTLRFTAGYLSYLLPYPLWDRALPEGDFSPVTNKINYVSVPWPSSITIDGNLEEMGYKLDTLLTTTDMGGELSGTIILAPDQEFSRENLGMKTLAISLEALPGSTGSSFDKLVLVGDSDFLTDQFIQGSPQNLAFGVNALSWLSGDISLSDIRIKAFNFGRFMFDSEDQAQNLKYINFGMAFFIPALFGTFYLVRRRSLGKKKYSD